MATSVTKKKVLVKKVKDLDAKENYCRICMKMRPAKDFYSSPDLELDRSGLLSVCKEHCAEIYTNSYNMEHSIEKALLRTCRILNIAYMTNAVEAAKKQIINFQNEGKQDVQSFGIYKSKLSTLSNLSDDTNLTFHSSGNNVQVSSSNETLTEDVDFNKYLKDFWGPDLVFEDYEFLESELARYKKTHKCDTATEESLLRQICFAELDIRKSRMGKGNGDASAVKRLQELMRTASVDPAKAATANSGKAQDTFSSFIKIIEENEPAEYYSGKDKDLFKDFDNIDFYFKKYVTRPLKNFITQSRDFNVDTEDDVDDVVDVSEE